MNRLYGTTVYLAGSIDHHENPRAWREDITRKILYPLGIKAYDPLVKPSWVSRAGKVHPGVYKELINSSSNLISQNQYNDVNREEDRVIWGGMMEVRRLCLRMAANADWMIVSLPKKFTVGTLEELSIASNAEKPVLIHAPDGIDVSTWLPSQISDSMEDFVRNCVFKDWESLHERVIKIDQGTWPVDSFKWIFTTYFQDEDIKKTHDFSDGQ